MALPKGLGKCLFGGFSPDSWHSLACRWPASPCVTSHHIPSACSSLQLCPTLCPHGLWPARFLCAWDSLGKKTGAGCHALLQGIFLNQGSNLHLLHLLHCRQVLSFCAAGEALWVCVQISSFYTDVSHTGIKPTQLHYFNLIIKTLYSNKFTS